MLLANVVSAGWRPSTIASTIAGASNVSRRMRLTYEGLIFSPIARSSMVPKMPVSNSLRHLKAQARALSMALSARGRSGTAAVPPCARTSFRPPRLRMAKGARTRTTSSARARAPGSLTLLPASALDYPRIPTPVRAADRSSRRPLSLFSAMKAQPVSINILTVIQSSSRLLHWRARRGLSCFPSNGKR
jgi:hypothetical protein